MFVSVRGVKGLQPAVRPRLYLVTPRELYLRSVRVKAAMPIARVGDTRTRSNVMYALPPEADIGPFTMRHECALAGSRTCGGIRNSDKRADHYVLLGTWPQIVRWFPVEYLLPSKHRRDYAASFAQLGHDHSGDMDHDHNKECVEVPIMDGQEC